MIDKYGVDNQPNRVRFHFRLTDFTTFVSIRTNYNCYALD